MKLVLKGNAVEYIARSVDDEMHFIIINRESIAVECDGVDITNKLGASYESDDMLSECADFDIVDLRPGKGFYACLGFDVPEDCEPLQIHLCINNDSRCPGVVANQIVCGDEIYWQSSEW